MKFVLLVVNIYWNKTCKILTYYEQDWRNLVHFNNRENKVTKAV